MNEKHLFISLLLVFTFNLITGSNYLIKSFDGLEINGELIEVNANYSNLVIIVAGSGPTDMNGNNKLYENNSYKMLAEALKEKEISSYRYDKRGVGKSLGKISSENEIKFYDYVRDLIEIISHFKKLDKFKNITIIGHSEGSLVGMLACQKFNVEGYISIAGPAKTILKTLKRQLSFQPGFIQSMSQPILEKLENSELVDSIPPLLMSIFRPSIQSYLIDWDAYDPVKEISKIDIPILIIHGTTDIQVEVEDAIMLNNSSEGSKLQIIEGMNHVFRQASDNRLLNLQTYGNPELPIDNNMVNIISEFIDKK